MTDRSFEKCEVPGSKDIEQLIPRWIVHDSGRLAYWPEKQLGWGLGLFR